MFAHRFAKAGTFGGLFVLLIALLSIAACGGIGCPDPFTAVDGVCVQLDEQPGPAPPKGTPERCDGEDNDLDDQIDELWPELGEPCGPSVGECTPGTYVCTADGRSIECEGAVGPSVEICDGLDNDCDGMEDNASPELCNGKDDDCNGLIDDGVLSIKQESFSEHATVAVTGDHYVVTRALPADLRVETYDAEGRRTGFFDDISRFDSGIEFIESSAWNGRVVVGYGQHRLYVLDIVVDGDGIPVILDQVRLHSDWDRGSTWFNTIGPGFPPRVSASPARLVGFSDVVTLSVTPLGDPPASDAALPPFSSDSYMFLSELDVAGPYVALHQNGYVRAGWLEDDGDFSKALDVAPGRKPAIAIRDGGPAVAFVQHQSLKLSELHAFSLQCRADRLCDASIDFEGFQLEPTTPVALGYIDSAEAWLVAFGDRLLVVGRVDGDPVVQQSWESLVGDAYPTRADVESNGSTAAIMQSSLEGESVLSFVGCF